MLPDLRREGVSGARHRLTQEGKDEQGVPRLVVESDSLSHSQMQRMKAPTLVCPGNFLLSFPA
eukprot:1740895-Prorocentrum_lima.AAC.1